MQLLRDWGNEIHIFASVRYQITITMNLHNEIDHPIL